ncbi:MAG: hypothetical protein WD556_11490 [Actinomycetota bacterium]
MEEETCILCGDEGPLTAEHLYPTWYSKMRSDLKFSFSGTLPGASQVVTRDVQKFDLAPAVLCKQCNNEWGSRLEEAIQPTLALMADGHVTTISLPMAKSLATWATLKFMVGEFLESVGRTPFFEPEQRRSLRNKRRPPVGTAIYLGRYVGEFSKTGRYWDQRANLSASGGEIEDIESLCANLAIGQAVFQLISFSRPDDLFAHSPIVQQVGSWKKALIKLWPLPEGPFNWPPIEAIDDLAFAGLVRRWDQPGS